MAIEVRPLEVGFAAFWNDGEGPSIRVTEPQETSLLASRLGAVWRQRLLGDPSRSQIERDPLDAEGYASVVREPDPNAGQNFCSATKHAAWRRAGQGSAGTAYCECKDPTHEHGDRCGRRLFSTRENETERKDGWRYHHHPVAQEAGGPDRLWNCRVICQGCEGHADDVAGDGDSASE